MTIADNDRYHRHREACAAGPWSRAALGETWLTMLLFGSMGAITWAIRGTGGWGGIDGTIVPGMTWGLLWCYLCHRKGIDARGIPLWLGLGIALGGELGYGQYVSWIRGMFNVGDAVVPVAPWIGWAWFALCGIGWGGLGGIALGWTLGGRTSASVWLVRLVVPLGAALLARLVIQAVPWLFFPNWDLGFYLPRAGNALHPTIVSTTTQTSMLLVWLAAALLVTFNWAVSEKTRGPRRLVRSVSLVAVACTVVLSMRLSGWLFFPEDSLGLGSGEFGKHLGRTVYTNAQNATVVAWWLGALLVAAIQRDRSTLAAGALLGGGFGFGFALAALWCLGYAWAPGLVDWWKMWELSAGFNLGLLYAVVLAWSVRQLDRTSGPNGLARATRNEAAGSGYARWCETAALAVGVFLVVYVMGREEFPTVAILLGLFYAVALALATRATDRAGDPQSVTERRRSISVTYSAFLLLFIMAWGVSSQTGILLGLYDAKAVDQYAWPRARVLLFAPAGVLIAGTALRRTWRILRGHQAPARPQPEARRLGLHMVDLMTLTGVVGAASIWPAKIGVLYALFLALALFAFHRLDCRLDAIDARP
ncbi:MAG: hypothetical protein BMS9Abin04_314 [Planctomycetia bacterium]|nr:MAG: hypothetical protein BMS9Abin04_314 [Planctomycetia bacterium]